MRLHAIFITTLILGHVLPGFSQECDTLLGYGKEDKQNIYIVKLLAGHVMNNEADTVHKTYIKTLYFKSQISSGLLFSFYFLHCGRTMDKSVKVKIEFLDSTQIILNSLPDTEPTQAGVGIFFFMAGSDYKHLYELTLLRTKPIAKIALSGDNIDSYTYQFSIPDSLEYMRALNCLSKLLN